MPIKEHTMEHTDGASDSLRRAGTESEGMRPRLEMDTPQESNSAVLAALSACRSSLERHFAGLREDGPRRDALESVRGSLMTFAAVTAAHEVPPERMIVMLKRMVREVTPALRWRDTERENISSELVEITIAAYFGADGNGRKSKR
jgi:hypothetical protein